MDSINMGYVINSLIFSAIGIVVFAASFILLDLLTPYKLWKEIVEKQNLALSIMVAGCAIGISLIIASAIHG